MADAENVIIILGGGITALQTALTLQASKAPRYKVTLVAQHFPGDESILYASPWAGAHWRTHATSAPEDAEQRAWDEETFGVWMEDVRRDKAGMEKRGLTLRQEFNYWSDVNPEIANGVDKLWWKDVVQDFKVLEKNELPSGVIAGVQYKTFCINTPLFLKALSNEVLAAGGKLVRAELPLDQGLPAVLEKAKQAAQMDHVMAFVNALGLAAGKMCGDANTFPVKGQTTLVKGELPIVKAQIWKDKVAFAIPRPGSGVTLLVGSKDANNWNEDVDQVLLARLLADCKNLVPELLAENGEFYIVSSQVGRRPARKGGARVEIEQVLGSQRDQTHVIHAYGHGGAGYQNSVGSANKVLRLLQMLKDIPGR